jgi:molybdopterin-guanine dinucleotide biosynthesis protein A
VDKALCALGGEPLLRHVVRALAPQVAALALNANGDPGRFASFGLPVIPDDLPTRPGPLAGLLAGMDWTARMLPAATHVVTVPADAPFLPADLVARLGAAGPAPAVAASRGRLHPVAGLWPMALAADLRRALVQDGVRKVEVWAERAGATTVAWADGPVDPFFNINTPEDLARAADLLHDATGGEQARVPP